MYNFRRVADTIVKFLKASELIIQEYNIASLPIDPP
jgi:hypothetical protein